MNIESLSLLVLCSCLLCACFKSGGVITGEDGARLHFYTADESGGLFSEEGAPRNWMGRFDAKTGAPVPVVK